MEVFWKVDVYQKLQPVIWPMNLHFKSNQYKVYVLQNKYYFSRGRMVVFLRKNYISRVYLDFYTFLEP